jgi:hypothetical protein
MIHTCSNISPLMEQEQLEAGEYWDKVYHFQKNKRSKPVLEVEQIIQVVNMMEK